jgi:hypothetical protein
VSADAKRTRERSNAEVDFPASQINVTSPNNFKAGLYQIYVLFDGLDVGGERRRRRRGVERLC